MATVHELKRLCTQADTRKLAQEIYFEAKNKTQPGSSYALSKPQALLPICAVIASIRLIQFEDNQSIKPH
jgi:hypothetical protein